MAQLILPDGSTIEAGEVGRTSDGYHTFDELYAHRCLLFVALMGVQKHLSWWARKHSDGSQMEGWIIAGMNLPYGAITYHLPKRLIPFLSGNVKEYDRAPEWDGHTSEDVLARLEKWIIELKGYPI